MDKFLCVHKEHWGAYRVHRNPKNEEKVLRVVLLKEHKPTCNRSSFISLPHSFISSKKFLCTVFAS
jgi:hypothetical protein